MKSHHGFSFTELLVVLALFGLLFSFLETGTRWHRTSLEAMEKTDLTSKLRNSSIVISRILSLSTRFLFPSTPSATYAHQLVFMNKDNEVGVIYLNDKGVLSYYNYTSDTSFEIAPFTMGFKCRLSKANLLEYQIDVKKDEYQFFLQNQLSTVNTLPCD